MRSVEIKNKSALFGDRISRDFKAQEEEPYKKNHKKGKGREEKVLKKNFSRRLKTRRVGLLHYMIKIITRPRGCLKSYSVKHMLFSQCRELSSTSGAELAEPLWLSTRELSTFCN